TGRYYLPGLYQLYRLNLQIPDQPRADYYKQLITGKFPETTYAKLVQNPDYLKEKETTLNEIEEYYHNTYALLNEGNYARVLQNVQYADTAFGKNDYSGRFALVKAMATGGVSGVDAYAESLIEVIANFPKTTEAAKAEEILAII